MDVTGVMSPTEATADELDVPAPAPSSLGSLASTAWNGISYVARTMGVPRGLRGVAVELAYTAVHLSVYPWGLLDEALRPGGVHAHHRTDTLPPGERSRLVSDLDGSATPVLLVHGIVDNRSIFVHLARVLRRRGHGTVQGVNYSPMTAFTGDIRAAARDLGEHVERMCAVAGVDRVHVIGHSLGGLIARYYVQRLGGDERVDTLVTLGTPHQGSYIAHLLPPTVVPRQLQPGSDLLTELTEPAPGCRTRFLAVWSRMDQLIIPQRNARLEHPDLQVTNVRLGHVGHMAMTIDPEVVHLVTCALSGTRPTRERAAERAGDAAAAG
ncbi:alpha/beta fold hydrolase [Actinomycetospora endophytica]|uniref:Alpha/beta fold hydrolase n=1 Tax=Actinomycetospora endophytica TaxID=2291215 RepID=A0ABS8P2K3_9PSEU|nr:alpha/beta fold hydrolase [Actinomycetospora endophytica]MCD2192464.1 alpha/beta fold hydrolase [Actinomycetospora endophytica]